MKKKRAYKRIAKRGPRRAARTLATARKKLKTVPVSLVLPANVIRFLRGVSDFSMMPIDVLINALLAVQVHAMREKT
jgi:hypothetical protein